MAQQPSQRFRLLFLGIYLALLAGTSWAAMDTVLPALSSKGLWLYSGFASLLLGSMLVSPYFTKPTDALANGVTALLGLFSAKPVVDQALQQFERDLFWATVSFASVVTILAVVAIALKDSGNQPTKRVAQASFLLAESLGSPRVIYSLLVVVSLILFHRNEPREYVLISASWILLFGVRPLEGLWLLGHHLRDLWARSSPPQAFGEVLAHHLPRLVLLRHSPTIGAGFGDLLHTRAPDSSPGVVMALDHIAAADGRWLRAVHIPLSSGETTALAGLILPKDVECAKLGDESTLKLEHNTFYRRRSELVGLVAPETNIERLRFEMIRDDLDLESGRLVEVRIGRSAVLCQVVNGVTKEEVVQQKHSRGFVIAEAVKIGCWSQPRQSFDPVNWVPLPSESVFLVTEEAYSLRADSVGNFPRTNYPLKIDVQQLVTHNAAILGVLGSGKSFLALELIERMTAEGIKTVCLDLTDQYEKELQPFINAELQRTLIEELGELGRAGKTRFERNVEEGGSVIAFRDKMKNHLEAFIRTDRHPVHILNPAALEVWRQDSKPFNNTASMATLSPAEITRIIAEVLLEVLQAEGMTSSARCCLVLEEAHSLVPEWNAVAVEGDKTATNGTAKAILQGRKFGLGSLLVTQRTANVTKTILNQCNTVFALRCYDDTSAKFLADYLGSSYSGVLSSLEDRYSVVYGRASSCKSPILVRLNDRPSFLNVFRTQAKLEDASS